MDAQAGASDVLTRQRRARADRSFGETVRRGEEVLGDRADASQRRYFAAMSEREEFRYLVEAFGQDPDSDTIRAWKDALVEHEDAQGQLYLRARTYRELNEMLRAKAIREGVKLLAA